MISGECRVPTVCGGLRCESTIRAGAMTLPNFFIVFNAACAMWRARAALFNSRAALAGSRTALFGWSPCMALPRPVLLRGIASVQRLRSLTLLGCGFDHRRQPSPAPFLPRLLLRALRRVPGGSGSTARRVPWRRIPQKPISRRRAASKRLRRRSIPAPTAPTAHHASRACIARWSVRFAAFI